MGDKKVILLIGAGATVSDAPANKPSKKPPLDKGFFGDSIKTNKKEVEKLASFLDTNYGIDVFGPRYDSLEKIMAILYSDLLDPSIRKKTSEQLRELVKLFIKRLSETTNEIKPHRRSHLYRVVVSLLNIGLKPEDITFITFNQDLQIEKTLFELSKTKRSSGNNIFSFPGIYRLPSKSISAAPQQTPVFQTNKDLGKGIAVLKLHGSLNWFSQHKSRSISHKTLFNKNRKFWITPRRLLAHDMRFKRGETRFYTFPVIVPPVTHKSGVLQRDIEKLWGIAEEKLAKANIVIVFGYSCPEADFESATMLSRQLQKRKDDIDFYIIDPNAQILARYAELTRIKKIYYYDNAVTFIDNIADDIELS